MLDQLATDSSARPAQARATEIAKAQATLAQTALAKAQEELPRTASAYYSALNADKANACNYTAKLELQPAQADVRYRYVARLKHNWLRDDTLKLAVNPAGLLTSANVVAVDRTGNILVDIAGAVAGGGGFGSPAMLTNRRSGPELSCGEPKSIIRILIRPIRGKVKEASDGLEAAKYPYRVESSPDAAADKAATTPPDQAAIDKAAADKVTADRATADSIHRSYQGAIFYRSRYPSCSRSRSRTTKPPGTSSTRPWSRRRRRVRSATSRPIPRRS